MSKSNKEKGTEYEIFIKEICERITYIDQLDSAVVKRDIKRKGRSGVYHQIDVFWNYVECGNHHNVIIECKDYNRRVSIDKVKVLHATITDIGGVEGVIVTKKGFQKGALEYAKFYGIKLLLMGNAPSNAVRSIPITVCIPTISELKVTVALDEKDVLNKGINIENFRQLDSAIRIEYDSMCHSNEVVNKEGSITLPELINRLPLCLPEGEYSQIFSFINGKSSINGESVRINGVRISYKIIVEEEESIVKSDEAISVVVKDIFSNEKRLL